MKGLLFRAVSRHHLQHPLQLGLSILGVAIGVALVVAMELAVQSAREAFRISAETVAGRATHVIEGAGGGVPDSVAVRLRAEDGLREVAPALQGFGASPRLPGRALRLLGVDPFQEAPLRPHLTGGGTGIEATGAGSGLDPALLLVRRGAVILLDETAAEGGLTVGDSLLLEVGGRQGWVELAAVLTARERRLREGLRDLVLMDISLAQDLLGRPGWITRVDLRLPEGEEGEAAAERIRGGLPAGLRLVDAGAREETLAGMIRAFSLNLTALSLLALVFGMFLIYNTMTFAVLQRRRLLGMLRALGATRGEVVVAVLREAALLGAAGTALGLALGVILGRGLVTLVVRTINDLYFVLSVEALALPPEVFLRGALLGIGATLLAALPPALKAAAVTPRAALIRSEVEERARVWVPRAAAGGLVLLAAGGGVLLRPGGVVAGFVGLGLMLLAVALMAPAATVVLVGLVRPLLLRTFGVLGAMAARSTITGLSRTAPAVAALVVAVAVTVGLGAMIGSFRTTLEGWLDQTLQADLYVSSPSTIASRAEGRLPAEVVEGAAGLPGVDGVSRYRGVELLAPSGMVRLVGLDLHPRGEPAFRFLDGLGDAGAASETIRRFREEGHALISEPLAVLGGLSPGDSVLLPSDRGSIRLPVAGIFRDYGSGQGVVMVSGETFRSRWDDREVTSLAVYLQPGASEEEVGRGLRELAAGADAQVVVRSNRALREGSLDVFDRTFAITVVLRGLAVGVAFIAVLSALMALQLERAREVALLRASGLTPGQLAVGVATQTGLLGTIAGLLALPAGALIATVMIFVVNRRSFGWTLDMHLGPDILWQAVALALGGSLLAAIHPAWRMTRTSPADALRGEGE